MTLTLKEFEDIPGSAKTGLTAWLKQLDYECPEAVPQDIKDRTTGDLQQAVISVVRRMPGKFSTKTHGDDLYVCRYEDL